jgi:hypothetical protein
MRDGELVSLLLPLLLLPLRRLAHVRDMLTDELVLEPSSSNDAPPASGSHVSQ